MIVQIAALPRSGTAWLTTVLNLAPNCFARHEAIVDGDDLSMEPVEDPAVRVDVSTYGFFPRARIYTAARRVLVYQDHHRSRERSARAFGFDPGPLQRMRDLALEWVEANGDGMIIRIEELFSLAGARQVWSFANPFHPFPEEKVKLMLNMKIERMNGREVFTSPEVVERMRRIIG